MSYQIFLLSDQVAIPRAKFQACVDGICAFHRSINPNIECPGGVTSFVAKSLDEKLVEAMAFFGWRPFLSDEGITGLDLELPRAGSVEFLTAIARHVEPDSYIEYVGEDGVATKHIFREKGLLTYVGKIQYDGLV